MDAGCRMPLTRVTLILTLLSIVSLSTQLSNPAAEETIKESNKGGQVHASTRLRYESVNQDGFSEDAQALTMRVRLGYRTETFHRFFANVEFESTIGLGSERYNSTANGKTGFPIVSDPEDSEINQGYLGYTASTKHSFKLGRQRVILDNARFVGNVGWRQNEQTFDAFSATGAIGDKFSYFLGHVTNVNRIFGEHHPSPVLADMDVSANLLNAALEIPFGRVTGYAYLLGNQDNPALSQQTFGLRFTGQHKFSDSVSALYTAEFADQSDYKDGLSTSDASYLLLEAGVGIRAIKAKLGQETLAGDGVYGFSTPLATLHAFNGWADKFLSTPATGLVDRYLSVAGAVRGFKITGVYHDFDSDQGSVDYGTELDLSITKSFKKHYSADVKYAAYSANTISTDTNKLWISLELTL